MPARIVIFLKSDNSDNVRIAAFSGVAKHRDIWI